MTWIIHRSQRDSIVNADAFQEICLFECEIVLSSSEKLLKLSFDTEVMAKQAFGYLMEAIKRGDQLVNI